MNDILLRTIRKENVERPPVWLMRQAGRILPEYRKIRASLSGFVELVTTPELAAEVTLQPVDILGVDAAIIFSDILVIPECMGLPYELIEKKGPYFPKVIESLADVDKLDSGPSAAEKLTYVFDALSITKKNLDNKVPLIGFSGAPWTLFAYMIEGQGSKTFSKAKAMLYKEPVLSHKLMEKITDTIIAYLKLKIQAGADVVQLFDSWAGILNHDIYSKFALPYIQRIVNEVNEVPFIFFARGTHFCLSEIHELKADVLGLDWTINPQQYRKDWGYETVVQGNLDPCVLYGSPDDISRATLSMLDSFKHRHIVNLGHGVYPDTPLDNVKHFIKEVQAYTYS